MLYKFINKKTNGNIHYVHAKNLLDACKILNAFKVDITKFYVKG